MSNFEANLNHLIEGLRKNLQSLIAARKLRLSQIRPPKLPGVYMLYFKGELQYIGSSGNLNKRVRTNLLSGNRKSHTLINKLCVSKNWSKSEAVSFLRTNSTIKFKETGSEDDAKILEDVLIAIYHPFYNIPLKKLKEQVRTQ